MRKFANIICKTLIVIMLLGFILEMILSLTLTTMEPLYSIAIRGLMYGAVYLLIAFITTRKNKLIIVLVVISLSLAILYLAVEIGTLQSWKEVFISSTHTIINILRPIICIAIGFISACQFKKWNQYKQKDPSKD